MLRDANFAIDVCIEDIRYHTGRIIDKKAASSLAARTYIEKRLNVVVSGRNGSEKSYTICTPGNAACRKLYRVKYYRTPELL